MRLLAWFVTLVALPLSGLAKDELKLGDLVKQHLNSIGTEQARATVKSRVVEGTVQFRVLSGGAGLQEGKEILVSEGRKLVSLLKLPNPNYHGERFVSDGNKTLVANVVPGSYSPFGRFVWVHNEILTEGLWGALYPLDGHSQTSRKGTQNCTTRG